MKARLKPSVKEIWKPAVPGFYEVSNLGRVRSVDRISSDGRTWTGKLLRPRTAEYKEVRLSIDGKPKFFTVHKLVATTFIGPCPTKKHEVNHKDGDKLNPKLKNLEYSTRKQNAKHASETKLMPTKKNGRWKRKWRPGK